MNKNKVNQLYENAWQFMRTKNRTELDMNDQVYINLISALYENVKYNPLFCEDIMISCTDRFLKADFGKTNVDKNRGENLIKYIIEGLELNKKVHYLLIPINGARLSVDIHFASFHFINGDEEEKEEKIQHITELDRHKIHDFIKHTQKSRSKDFMMYPILVLKMDNVHSNIYRSASVIAQRIFQIIKLMVYKFETKQDIYELVTNPYEANYHVAIIGEEDWQFGHRNWWNLIQCKYSLDFLSELNNQNEFVNLANTFVFESYRDELHYKFSNALELFEKSLEQYENYNDITLSMMLLFSAAESLLTEGDNEKKLRLSVIWPRLVTITDKEQKDLCILIRDSYDKRNNFVHAGNLMYDSERKEIRVLHQMLAKLISKYLLPDVWKNMEYGTEDKDITKWTKYVKNIFTEAIYS
ncbi:MAG: hypothetical protein HDT40_09260 [Lachnospiraceae bacterium]|nr:hypothetical protein [Lachnospiraceae bacterium]